MEGPSVVRPSAAETAVDPMGLIQAIALRTAGRLRAARLHGSLAARIRQPARRAGADDSTKSTFMCPPVHNVARVLEHE